MHTCKCDNIWIFIFCTGGTKTMRDIPYALICAGTDLNEFSKEVTSLRLMTRAILSAK